MGKNKKDVVIISGLDLNDGNRGTAALGYGSISFLANRYGLTTRTEIVRPRYVKKFWKKEYRTKVETVRIAGKDWRITTIPVFVLEEKLHNKFGISLPFTPFGKALRRLAYVAAINGGDGFADIYGTDIFHSRLHDTKIAMKQGIPVIQLPQTLGPFKDRANYDLATCILRYSQDVYVRDDKFVDNLREMGVKYELTNDLSYFMESEPWDIDIKPGSVGINVSGLAYSNKFGPLSGQFTAYPYLVRRIIEWFLQNTDKTIYLISHSYNYGTPEPNNDDIEACRETFRSLNDKSGRVVLVDRDLNSPQTKYLISKMAFFVGTRMHANFAAIFTKVPLFGLAYSYKFEGAFNRNGIFGQTAMINDITKAQADEIVETIAKVYREKTSLNPKTPQA